MTEELGVEKSIAQKYMEAKGWQYRIAGNQLVTSCPLCGKVDKFYMAMDPRAIKTGARPDIYWDCKVCERAGSLGTLKKELGDPIEGVQSMQDGVDATHAVKPLPELFKHHRMLMDDPDTMNYLVCERGYSMDVIEKMQLGLGINGEEKWLVFPYVNAGKYCYAKMRSLPPMKKAFKGAGGRENPLYNADVIHPNTEELIFVEGEGDCLTMLTHDYPNTIGVPGAGMKKATWIERLDVWWEQRAGKPRQIYILYDSDKVGQEAAAEIIKRIGIDRCKIIKLPPFTKTDATPGKDVTEWFQAGHTREEFESLKASAKQLEIKGIMGIMDALDQMQNELETRGTMNAEINTPWEPLNKIFGGADYGDVIGVMAEGKVGKTTFGMNWIDYIVGVLDIPSLLLCFEMPQKRVARKWACKVTETDDSKFDLDAIQRARNIIYTRKADLVLGYTSAQNVDDVFDLIRQTVRRYGVRVVMLDNLQLMVRGIRDAPQETSVLTKRIKDLAMELNIVIILIIQPKRVEANEIVAARHASGSAAIEKDVDAMLCLHRNREGVIKADEFQGSVEQDTNFKPWMLIRVDLSRYSAGGATTLYMDGAKSLIRVMTSQEDRARAEAPGAMGSELPVEGQAGDL